MTLNIILPLKKTELRGLQTALKGATLKRGGCGLNFKLAFHGPGPAISGVWRCILSPFNRRTYYVSATTFNTT